MGEEKERFLLEHSWEKSSFPLEYNVLSFFTSDVLSGIRFNEKENDIRIFFFRKCIKHIERLYRMENVIDIIPIAM